MQHLPPLTKDFYSSPPAGKAHGMIIRDLVSKAWLFPVVVELAATAVVKRGQPCLKCTWSRGQGCVVLALRYISEHLIILNSVHNRNEV